MVGQKLQILDDAWFRPKISRAALTSLSLSGFQKPNHDIPCSHQICPTADAVGKSSCLASFPVSWTSCTPPGPQPNRFYHPACLWNYPNKPITSPCRNQEAPHPLVITKPATHSPFWFILLPSVSPMRPCVAGGVLLPQAVSLCHQWTAVSFLCLALDVMCPAIWYYLEQRSPPSTIMWTENGQKRQMRRISENLTTACTVSEVG